MHTQNKKSKSPYKYPFEQGFLASSVQFDGPIQKSIHHFAICRATLSLESLCKILPAYAGQYANCDLVHELCYPCEMADNYLITKGGGAQPHLDIVTCIYGSLLFTRYAYAYRRVLCPAGNCPRER